MRRAFIVLLLAMMPTFLSAQCDLSVVAYDDDASVIKEAYRESPYYMELTGAWKQRRTDSSVLYSRQLAVGDTWKDYLVYLNVRCGRACRVSVGGKEVGYAGDSRHWNSFLLTPFLKYGRENTLVIEALVHPDDALLEDTTIAVGLNGEPYILFKSDPGVADLGVVTDYDAATGSGTLTVDALVSNSRRKGRYYLEVEVIDPNGRQLDRMGRWIIFEKTSEERVDISRTWSGVNPWSAEQPSLYTALVRLRNEKMEEEELVGTRFGFRRVEVADGRLLVNGRPIPLRGVTYGVEHTEGLAGRQQHERAIQAMKANNINAVRTSRYSPMEPWFYSLCDRYGLYVVADANLMPASSGRRAVATEQDMIPLFEQRVNNLYTSHRNHPSIIVWSLGNTADNGVCMTAAYRRLKALDKSRPVAFSGAQYGENTDIIFPSFPQPHALKQSLAKPQTRPTVIGRMAFDNVQQIMSLNGQQGGFVEAWPLASDWLYELRNLYAPFSVSIVRVGGGEGEFRVSNLCDFANFAQNSLQYTIYTNLRPNIISGELPLAVRAGESDKVKMQVPQLQLRQGEDPYIRFDVRSKKGGIEVGRMVFPLQMRRPARETNPAIGNAANQNIRFVEDSVGKRIVTGNLTVATFDSLNNLTMAQAVPYLLFDNIVSKRKFGSSIVHVPEENVCCIDAMTRYTDAEGRPLCEVSEAYTVYSSGDIVIDYTLSSPDGGKCKLPAMVRIADLHSGQALQWYGQERRTLMRGTSWHSPAICSLPTDQFSVGGERNDVRWLLLTDPSNGSSLFACIADTTATMRRTADGLVLIPQGDHFRLHLKTWNLPADSLADLCATAAYRMPTVSSGIPKPPVITADAPRFAQPIKVTITQAIKQSNTQAIIRYTLDGSEPDENSPVYKAPFTLDKTTVVKARVYIKDTPPSFTATRKFNYDYILRTTFSRKPNTPYNIGADTLLFDGDRGMADNLNFGWLGFSGGDMATTVELAKPLDVESVTLRFAHNPTQWAFAPTAVTLSFSTDGQNFTDTVQATIPFDPTDQSEDAPRVVELKVPSTAQGVGFMRISVSTIGQIPAWHRAKGLNPWLMMDEIEINERITNENTDE